jgi:acyl-CoA thioester hydrolase
MSGYHVQGIVVREEWIDYNGHVNDSAYAVICAEANERFLEHVGVSADYQGRTGCTTYTVESHLRYLDEVGRGAVLHADVLPVDADAKRLRLHTSVYDGDRLVLTGEYLFLHVDQNAGRVTPFPDDRARAIADEVARYAGTGRPDHLGRGVRPPGPG